MRMPSRFVLSCLLAGVAWPAPGAAPPSDDRISWLNNYREALREARQTQKPIFLEFRCEA